MLILSEAELLELTGYKQPAAQLAELQRRGFHRAYRNRLGRVTLERAHYEAVCALRAGSEDKPRPRVRLLPVQNAR